jgi:hypothetical protein
MDGPMPSGLPVDPHQGFWKGGAIAQLTKPVVIDETRPIDETRHDEIGCDRRHPAGGSPPSPQTVSASSLGVANEDAVDVGTVCACKGQVHIEYIPSAREVWADRHADTWGASCGLGMVTWL